MEPIRTKSARHDFTATRDEHGVPHVTARSWPEALYGWAYLPYLAGTDFEPLRDIQIPKRLSDEALELLADLPRLAGSNAWAVSPARSATGRALLASDPHLEVNRLPAFWRGI